MIVKIIYNPYVRKSQIAYNGNKWKMTVCVSILAIKNVE